MGEIVLESAAEGFCCDVEEIARQYRKEAAPISANYDETMNEARKLERMAREEYTNAARDLHDKYAARILHAASIRKSKAEHPEQIDKAARTVATIMGRDHIGGMSEDEARNARRVIENAERQRLQAEENERKYAEIKPGSVW